LIIFWKLKDLAESPTALLGLVEA